jgi:hypothetical protein
MAGDTPVAGLWINNLHFDLLWYTEQPGKRLLTSGIPSWSWASMNVPITSPYCSPLSEEIVYKLQTINLDLQWSGTSLTSQIVKGMLTVEGRTRTLTVGPPREPMFMHNYDFLPRRQVGSGSDEIEMGCCSFDEEPPLVGNDILCLEVCHSQDWKNDNSYYMLLVASTSRGTDQYVRLGVGFIRTSARDEYFDGIPPRAIALM